MFATATALVSQYVVTVSSLSNLTSEFPFVRGHDDAWEALQWVRIDKCYLPLWLLTRLQIHQNAASVNARSDSISIGGVSAGGHISAALQQLARTKGLDLKLGKGAKYFSLFSGYSFYIQPFCVFLR